MMRQYEFRPFKANLPVTIDSLEIRGKIGKGGFSRVFAVTFKDDPDKRLYALKVQNKRPNIEENDAHEKKILHERFAHSSIKNTNFLLRSFYAFQSLNQLFLITEFCEGGDMRQHLRAAGKFTLERTRFYIAQLVIAVSHLHKLNIVHRDIKPDNMLLDYRGHLVLGDFGLSIFMRTEDFDKLNKYIGTLQYMAPEVLKRDVQGYNHSVDWWAVGIITYEFLLGVTPFANRRVNRNSSKFFEWITDARIRFPTRMPKYIKDFICSLLNRDPLKRLGGDFTDAEPVRKHRFFQAIKWYDIYMRSGWQQNFTNYYGFHTDCILPRETVLEEPIPTNTYLPIDNYTYNGPN